LVFNSKESFPFKKSPLSFFATVPMKVSKTATIPVLDQVDADTFYGDYIRQNRPCLIKGGADSWPAAQRWQSDDYLEKVLRDKLVPRTTSVRSDLGFDHQSPIDPFKFSEFLSVYRNNPQYYLNDAALPGILLPDIGFHVTLEVFKRLEDYHRFNTMFFSGGDQLAPLHYDDEDNIYAMIFGEKEFYLHDIADWNSMYPHDDEKLPDFSQINTPINLSQRDHDRFPRFKESTCYKIRVQAGDILYVPAYWWHTVHTKGRSVAVSFVRLDRESQYRVFRKLLESDVFPISPTQKEKMLARARNPDQTVREISENRLPVDCLFFLYMALASLHVHLKHQGGDLKDVETAFSQVKPKVLEVVKQRSFSYPIQYLVENFFRVTSGMFRINE